MNKNPGTENFRHDFEAKIKVTSDEAWLAMLITEKRQNGDRLLSFIENVSHAQRHTSIF